MAKIIITESMFKRLISEGMLNEISINDVIKSAEFKSKVKDIVKTDKELEKDIEKKVKSIVAKAVENLFRALWFKKDVYKSDIER